MWQQGGIRLDEAARGQRTSVILPEVYPHPLWAYALSEASEASVELCRHWYGLDDSVQIAWQRRRLSS